MSSGITHSKWSKRLFGKYYSRIHKWMDKPSQTFLKWNHRLINHNLLITPVLAVFKFKTLIAGFVVLQHLYQDYERIILYSLLGFFIFSRTPFFKYYLGFVLFFLSLDVLLKTFFDIIYRIVKF